MLMCSNQQGPCIRCYVFSMKDNSQYNVNYNDFCQNDITQNALGSDNGQNLLQTIQDKKPTQTQPNKILTNIYLTNVASKGHSG